MTQTNSDKQAPWLVITIIILGIVALVWFFIFSQEDKQPVPQVTEQPLVEKPVNIIEETLDVMVEPEIPVKEAPTVSENLPEVEAPILPSLDESDELVVSTLPKLTWRNELLKLIVTEDIIRRVVVFVDNFQQGTLAYAHSPLTLPSDKFFAIKTSNERWIWDEASAKRFSLYLDLLRSLDSDALVNFYFEIKPLIDSAYNELGYPDRDFTDVLQTTITQILDLDFPEQPIELERPSVMYKFKDESLENLDDTNKLFLRLGKENILVIKSMLLEINEKLSRAQNKLG